MLSVAPIAAFNDNYIWLLIAEKTKQCLVVDPGDAAVVIEQLNARNLSLNAILITHHHADHTGGIEALVDRYHVPVYGPAHEAINHLDHQLVEGDELNLLNTRFKVYETPGHTLGHIVYLSENDQLFCGDTLFAAGCGRIFEGKPAQMYASLNKLRALPEHTEIYCAHEYTEANLRFALAVEPDNEALQQRQQYCRDVRLKNQPTLPSRITDELNTNPFFRCQHPGVRKAVEHYQNKALPTAVDVFTALRAWKDEFRG